MEIIVIVGSQLINMGLPRLLPFQSTDVGLFPVKFPLYRF